MKIMIPHSPQYITHILQREAVKLWSTYHNIIIQYLNGKACSYLFAHFAWAILLKVKLFITDDLPRHVIQIKVSDEDKIKYKKELLSGSQLKAYYSGRQSKGATPKNKRSRTDSRADDEDSDVNMDNEWEDMMSGWQQQGKKRRKQISTETAVEEDNQAHQLAELRTHLEEILPGGGDNIPEQG